MNRMIKFNKTVEVLDFQGEWHNEIRIDVSQKGFPVFWENGSGYSNTGDVQLIMDHEFGPKRPLFIANRSDMEQALFLVEKGDVILKLHRHHDRYTIKVYRVIGFKQYLNTEKTFYLHYAYLTDAPEYLFYNGEWNDDIPPQLQKAVDVAIKKSNIYHCKRAMYYKK